MRWLVLSILTAAAGFAQLPSPNDAGVSMGHVHLMLGDADAQKKIWLDVLGAQPTKTGTLDNRHLRRPVSAPTHPVDRDPVLVNFKPRLRVIEHL